VNWNRYAVKRALIRVGLAALLVGVYVGAWRPMRAALAGQVAAPTLRAVDTSRAERFTVAGGEMMTQVRAPAREGRHAEQVGAFRAPAGAVLWLMPAVLLLFLFPRRPYWLYLWLLHLGMGGLSLGLLAGGLAWTDVGFAANSFWWAYGVPAVSFAAPLLMWRWGRARTVRQ
jgi:hypothetical protein